MRRIVVCGDDFGMNAAVDGGILRLAEMGRLSAASCLATGPSFAAGAAALRSLDVDVGLHLNLTDAYGGESVMPLPVLIARSHAGLLDAAWVDAAVQRQLDVFERAHGRGPDYVDGHRHVHQLPCVLPRLRALLRQRYGEQQRPWLRCTLPRAAEGLGLADTAKARLIGALGGRALRRAARAEGWRHNARLLGVYGLRGGADGYAERLHRWLLAARDGDLLMCHPAVPAPAGAGPLAAQRAAEFEVLSAPGLAWWLRINGLAIERFSRMRPRQDGRESGRGRAVS